MAKAVSKFGETAATNPVTWKHMNPYIMSPCHLIFLTPYFHLVVSTLSSCLSVAGTINQCNDQISSVCLARDLAWDSPIFKIIPVICWGGIKQAQSQTYNFSWHIGYVWSPLAPYNPQCSPYYLIRSWSPKGPNCPLWICMVSNGLVWSCMVRYSLVRLPDPWNSAK